MARSGFPSALSPMNCLLLRRPALLSLATVLLVSTPAALTAPLTLYVSPVGKDTWSGRLAAPAADRTDGPLATLPAALQAARLARQTTPGPTEAITILLRGGTYELRERVTLTA